MIVQSLNKGKRTAKKLGRVHRGNDEGGNRDSNNRSHQEMLETPGSWSTARCTSQRASWPRTCCKYCLVLTIQNTNYNSPNKPPRTDHVVQVHQCSRASFFSVHIKWCWRDVHGVVLSLSFSARTCCCRATWRIRRYTSATLAST